ncbi:MAG: GNAT family N-acetyltransferase, partial [Propioniciclava sp.]
MPPFAEYLPQAHGVPLSGIHVRQASAADTAVTAALAAEREGDELARCRHHQMLRLEDRDHRLFVAEAAGDVRGYGWISYLQPVRCGGHGAPDGWYLSGLVIASSFRRQGLGRQLTQARIAWVLERAEQAYYVVSASNAASLRLHESLGMVAVTRDFAVPGVVFSHGDG